MKEQYETVSGVIERLRIVGFTVDFQVKDNCLIHPMGQIKSDDFIIVDVYRCEGNSDPADDVAVYAIEAYGGGQGILGTGNGTAFDSASEEILLKFIPIRVIESQIRPLTFSFARAIQQPALDLWQGRDSSVEAAQQALFLRASYSRAARQGKYQVKNT